MSPEVLLRTDEGWAISLDPHRWSGRPGPEEEEVLTQVVGPALDVGCGPGRHVLALAERGVAALGIDISPVAVTMARGRGATVLQRCVFRPLPLDAMWRTVLLLDGNIGIGGHPTALLRRVGQLLAPGGRALVEVDAAGAPTRPLRVRVERGAAPGPWFAWASVSVSCLPGIAEAAGLEAGGAWESSGRWFASLERRFSRPPAGEDAVDDPDGPVGGHGACDLCDTLRPSTDPWATVFPVGA